MFCDIFRLILTFYRRHSYFFRNENNRIMWEDFTSSICWLRSKMIFFMKMNSNIFAYFTSSICSLHPYSCIFYLEYLLITSVFLHILPRISAHFIHKILNSRNSEWEPESYDTHPVENSKAYFIFQKQIDPRKSSKKSSFFQICKMHILSFHWKKELMS